MSFSFDRCRNRRQANHGHRHRFAPGEIGIGCVAGVCPAKVMINTQGDPAADIAHQSRRLVSGAAGGAEILWAQPGTGEKWAVVRIAPVDPSIERIELAGLVMPGTQYVEAALLDWPEEPHVTVYFPAAGGYGIGRAGAGSHAGSICFARWSRSRWRWEVVGGQFKLISEAKTYEPIAAGARGSVRIWWEDYATGELVDSGQTVTAMNWLFGDLPVGAKVVVSYDRQEGRWSIVGRG